MIRAFAPGMTMQEPLPQAASSFDVRNEPTAPESKPAMAGAGDHRDHLDQGHPDEAGAELARLEDLLLERTRERRELAQELDRRSELLREACARLTELAPQVAEAATEHAVHTIREERDAAVTRAVEAELARADAAFRVDELMGQLLGSGRAIPESAISPSPSERVLSARLAELDEQKQMADARLMLVEDELAQARSQLATAARERVETAERLELEIGQARVWAETAHQKLSELADARGALLGERDGTRARLGEAERALVASQERLTRTLHQASELRDKLELARAERANTLTLADARALQIDELTNLRAQDQEQLRELRAAHERAIDTSGSGADANLTALRDELERERTQRAETTTAFAARESTLAELMTELERERASQAESARALIAHEATLADLRAQLERERAQRDDATHTLEASEVALDALRAEVERERAHSLEIANLLSVRDAKLAELQEELDTERAQRTTSGHSLDEVESTLAELQAEVELKQLQITASAKALTTREAAWNELQAELEQERAARSWLAAQLAEAEAGRTADADPEATQRRASASNQDQVETLRACLLELRLPLLEFENELGRIAHGKDREPNDADSAYQRITSRILIDPETLSALDEQMRQKDTKIDELEAALAAERQARAAASPSRDTSVATLKGELIDIRANATRLSDDLTRERARRRKMAVTVRALQAATDSGEAPGPWIEELIALINEGASSLPPRS